MSQPVIQVRKYCRMGKALELPAYESATAAGMDVRAAL